MKPKWNYNNLKYFGANIYIYRIYKSIYIYWQTNLFRFAKKGPTYSGYVVMDKDNHSESLKTPLQDIHWEGC